ncbi:MAG TPA: RcnB family protein [Ramlibacter sp.]|nr:RcnB family protein [Ramlibacter sp.]
MRSSFIASAIAAAALAFGATASAQSSSPADADLYPTPRPPDVHTQVSNYESWLQSRRNLSAGGLDLAMAGPPPSMSHEALSIVAQRHGPHAAYAYSAPTHGAYGAYGTYGGPSYQLQQRIGNWRSHGLPRPPAQHGWYRTTDNHYALVNLASGAITQVLASR